MPETKGLGLYNVVVIGAGTAGLVTAAGTAGLGGRVALLSETRWEAIALTTAVSRARPSSPPHALSIAFGTPPDGV
jgi:threonine dehydrogenase-like Zn-dependent dehydrogenase